MKLTALLLFAGLCPAAAIVTYTPPDADSTFTAFVVTGAATPIPDGWFVDLDNDATNYRTVTFTSPVPLDAFSVYIDTLPFQPGTGTVLSIDGEVVWSSPKWVLVQNWLTVTNDTLFLEVMFSTNFSSVGQERADLLYASGTPTTIPEPGTWALGCGLALIAWGKKRRHSGV